MIKTKINNNLPFPAGFVSNNDEETIIKSSVSVSKENIEENNVSSKNASMDENKNVSSAKELNKSNKDQSK